jgi:hypothetical protein
MAFFITFGAVLTLLGALLCRSYHIKYAGYRCFPAEVLGFRSEFRSCGENEKEFLCTVVDYKSGTETIRANHTDFIPAEDIPVQRGDNISVHVDPAVPDKFLFTSDVKGTSAFGSALIIGGLLTVFFHIIWGLLF